MDLPTLPHSRKQQNDGLEKDKEISTEGRPYKDVKISDVSAILCP